MNEGCVEFGFFTAQDFDTNFFVRVQFGIPRLKSSLCSPQP